MSTSRAISRDPKSNPHLFPHSFTFPLDQVLFSSDFKDYGDGGVEWRGLLFLFINKTKTPIFGGKSTVKTQVTGVDKITPTHDSPTQDEKIVV